MKNTYNITVHRNEYNRYKQMLKERGFKQIGTRLFEDAQTYVRVTKEGRK